MLKVGVIGVGNMGKHHARVYSDLGSANLVAVCDPDKERGEEIAERFKCRFYPDHIDMLKNEEIDAVSVVVPTRLHKDIVIDCIKHGKHVLVEKPISDTIQNAEEIIRAAEENKVKLAVGHIERFNPAVQRLKDMIRKGELGRITTIAARRVGVSPPQVKDANVIVDIGVHDIDVLNYLLEKVPTCIYSSCGRALTSSREDYADILLKYNDTNAFIQVNWITPIKIRELAVTGTKGYAELNYITQELVFYRSNYRRIDDFSDVVKFGTPEKIEIRVDKAEPLRCELESFLDCIENDKKPVVTGEDGLVALDIALKAAELCNKK